MQQQQQHDVGASAATISGMLYRAKLLSTKAQTFSGSSPGRLRMFAAQAMQKGEALMQIPRKLLWLSDTEQRQVHTSILPQFRAFLSTNHQHTSNSIRAPNQGLHSVLEFDRSERLPPSSRSSSISSISSEPSSSRASERPLDPIARQSMSAFELANRVVASQTSRRAPQATSTSSKSAAAPPRVPTGPVSSETRGLLLWLLLHVLEPTSRSPLSPWVQLLGEQIPLVESPLLYPEAMLEQFECSAYLGSYRLHHSYMRCHSLDLTLDLSLDPRVYVWHIGLLGIDRLRKEKAMVDTLYNEFRSAASQVRHTHSLSHTPTHTHTHTHTDRKSTRLNSSHT